MSTKRTLSFSYGLVAAVALLGAQTRLQAGSFITDFNSGLPTNSTVFGSATISTNGGFTNSGCLKLTTAVNSQNASFIITNDLDSGIPIVSFATRFKLLIGGGNGADGFSFNFAPNLPMNTIGVEGAGSGLTVEFDTYNNGFPDTAPAIDIKVGGSEIATAFYHGLRTGTFVDVVIQLNPDNTLSVAYDGNYIYTNLNLATSGYVPAAGSLFGLGAATGGVNDNHWVDNLSIITQTNAAAFVNTFGPQGRGLASNDALGFATNSTIDIVLTDNTTQVNTNSISLMLDGTSISPVITTNGSGNTFVHYAPPAPFAYSSTHSVSLVFMDNATPTPQTNALQYSFLVADPAFVPGAYVTVFSDGFESYVAGGAELDKNDPLGANAAPNGSGNPWFGPNPPNALVVGAGNGVTPHSGTNMITGHLPNDGDDDWYNLSYRLRGGQVFKGNFMLDWWFYDPNGPGDTQFGEYVALAYYNTVPTTTDYPSGANLFSGVTVVQRISLGGSVNQSDHPGAGSLYDSTLYQGRVVNGVYDYAYGWFNTTAQRSVGWHHGRIIAGSPLPDGTCPIYFYIDNMVTPVGQQNSATSYGFNNIEINSGQLGTVGYFDDFSFALAVPPNLSVRQSGGNTILAWPGSGWTLQSASSLNGPWSDVAGATSGYSYSTMSGPRMFFRLRN